MEINLSQKVTISSDALFQEVSGEIVILDLKSESYFGLNEVGARIWQLMKEHQELQKVYDVMLQEFDVEACQLRGDMQDLLGELFKAGLVTLDDREEA